LRILTLLPDVRHVQESGALKADLDERRLHARKHPRDFADIDVAHEAPVRRALDVQAPAARPPASRRRGFPAAQ